MNARKHMIIIKGEIKTSEVRFCRYNSVTKKMDVEFINGEKYPYTYSNVEWLKEPIVLNPNLYRISREGREFFDIEAIYVFRGTYDEYWHICFGNGSERDYPKSELKIVESCLNQEEAANVFEYIRQIAKLSNLRNEETGEKILAKRFEKISFIGNEVALAKYLNPSLLQQNRTRHEYIPIFPFGCNNSQYKAVKRAFCPNGLPPVHKRFGITADNIITHPSAPRNKLIAETLQSLKYVQRTGQGVDIIYKEMVSMGKPYPVYRVFSDAVQLTIESAMEDPDFVRFIVKEQDSKQISLSLSQLMILRYIVENRKIKLADVQQVAQISAEDARKCCAELMKVGLIEIIGKEYMLTARVYEAVKSDIEYTRDKTVQYIKAKDMITEYIKLQGYINRSTVQELCGFTDQQARRTIEKMKEENIIEMSNGGRYAKYILKEV